MDVTTGLWALFVSSFLAATLLPGGSEAVLLAVLAVSPDSAVPAVAVATAGNTLGGAVSYMLGRLIPQSRPLKGLTTMRRYGAPMLLLSWVPFIGDALCVAAGWLRLNPVSAVIYMAIGKFGRYLALVLGVMALR